MSSSNVARSLISDGWGGEGIVLSRDQFETVARSLTDWTSIADPTLRSQLDAAIVATFDRLAADSDRGRSAAGGDPGALGQHRSRGDNDESDDDDLNPADRRSTGRIVISFSTFWRFLSASDGFALSVEKDVRGLPIYVRSALLVAAADANVALAVHRPSIDELIALVFALYQVDGAMSFDQWNRFVDHWHFAYGSLPARDDDGPARPSAAERRRIWQTCFAIDVDRPIGVADFRMMFESTGHLAPQMDDAIRVRRALLFLAHPTGPPPRPADAGVRSDAEASRPTLYVRPPERDQAIPPQRVEAPSRASCCCQCC